MGTTLEKLFERISSYQILNFLYTGIVCWYGLIYLGFDEFQKQSITTTLIGSYFIGMTMSRIGSLVIEECFIKWNWIEKTDHGKQVCAEKMDSKVELMLSLCNTYRTFAAIFLVFLLLSIITKFCCDLNLKHNITFILISLALTVLYSFSFVKQYKYVKKRVDNDVENNSNS